MIASWWRDQRGLAGETGQPDVFGAVVARGFAGEADANRDGRVAVAELLEFLPCAMRSAVGAGRQQTAVVFQPDAKPPRLGEPADAVTKMLRHLRELALTSRWRPITRGSQGLAPKEPDLPLAFGLVLLRHNRLPLSRPILERVRLEHSKSPVAHQVIAWQDFLQGRLGGGDRGAAADGRDVARSGAGTGRRTVPAVCIAVRGFAAPVCVVGRRDAARVEPMWRDWIAP